MGSKSVIITNEAVAMFVELGVDLDLLSPFMLLLLVVFMANLHLTLDWRLPILYFL